MFGAKLEFSEKVKYLKGLYWIKNLTGPTTYLYKLRQSTILLFVVFKSNMDDAYTKMCTMNVHRDCETNSDLQLCHVVAKSCDDFSN